jgi:hypothetical protein
MMDPGYAPDVTCPGCQGLDWSRDGFAVRADGPRIDAARFAPSSADTEPWRCGSCGFALTDGDPLAAALTGVQEAHWE